MAFSSSVIRRGRRRRRGGRRGRPLLLAARRPPAPTPRRSAPTLLRIMLDSPFRPARAPGIHAAPDPPNADDAIRGCPARQTDGTIGVAREQDGANGARHGNDVAVPRRRRAREWPRPRRGRAPRARRRAARPTHHPRAAAHDEPAPVVFVPGHHGQPAAAAGRQRGLAQPRQHDRPPRPARCPARCRSAAAATTCTPASSSGPTPSCRARSASPSTPTSSTSWTARGSSPALGKGHRYAVFTYDWRRDLVESARGLALRLEGLAPRWATRGARFHIVGHSMGGLVARYYLRYGGAEPRGRARALARRAARRRASSGRDAERRQHPRARRDPGGRARRLLLHDARGVGREPDAVRLPAAAAGRHAARSSTRAATSLDRRPARPGDVGALRLGALRARRRRRLAPSERVPGAPRSSARGPSTRPSPGRPRPPARCRSTRSAATACSPLARAVVGEGPPGTPPRLEARTRREQDLLYEAGDGRVTRASLLAAHLPGAEDSLSGQRLRRDRRSRSSAAPTTTGSTRDPAFQSLLLRLLLRPAPRRAAAARRAGRRACERRERGSANELRAVMDTLRRRDQQYRRSPSRRPTASCSSPPTAASPTRARAPRRSSAGRARPSSSCRSPTWSSPTGRRRRGRPLGLPAGQRLNRAFRLRRAGARRSRPR